LRADASLRMGRIYEWLEGCQDGRVGWLLHVIGVVLEIDTIKRIRRGKRHLSQIDKPSCPRLEKENAVQYAINLTNN
jgi:hypothetical protein